MSKLSLIVASLMLPLGAMAGPVATPNLLVNGSFEQTHVSHGQWHILPSLPGWTSGPLGIELRNNVSGSAQDGNNFVELDTKGNSFMMQDLLGDQSLLGPVKLSFWFSARPGTSVVTNDLLFGFGQDTYSLLGYGNRTHQHDWNFWSGDFDLSSTDSLFFRAVGASDSLGMSLDNISVMRTTQVPEPSSLALTGLALLACCAAYRRLHSTDS